MESVTVPPKLLLAASSRRAALPISWRRRLVLVGSSVGVGVGVGLISNLTNAGPVPSPASGSGARTNNPTVASGELLGWSLPFRNAEGHLVAKLSGAGAKPLPNGLFAIRELKVDLYTSTGEPRASLTTPACRLGDNGKAISSPESFILRQSVGHAQLQGEGFYLNLESHNLIISNHLEALLPFRFPKRTASQP